jgi:hypothetical protein
MRLQLRALLSVLIFWSITLVNAHAQILTPVKWEFSIRSISDVEAEVVAKAKIDKGWHVYALKVSDKPLDIAPIPTTLKLDKSKDFSLVGGVKEGKYIKHYDPQFEGELNYFENEATFTQRIKILSTNKITVTGELQYMACDEVQCIFPDPEFFELTYT